MTVEDETEFNNVNNWTIPSIKKEMPSLLDVTEKENHELETKSLYLKSLDKRKASHIKVLQIKAYTENEAIAAPTFFYWRTWRKILKNKNMLWYC